MNLPVDGPGRYRVAVEVACNQEKQAAEDKLTASILAGKVSLNLPQYCFARATNSVVPIHQVITGIIADVQYISNHGSCKDPPLDRLSLELTTLGLNEDGAVVPVIPTYLLVCGAIDPSTLEGAAGRYPIWPTNDCEGTGHDPLPFWRFSAYPFLGSKVINLSMRTGKLDLAEAAKRAFALASTGTKWRHPWATDEDVLFRDASDVSRDECRMIHMCHEKPPRPNVGRTIAGSLSSAVLWETSQYGWDGKQPARLPVSFQGGSSSGSSAQDQLTAPELMCY
jgi:hypothetical protein